MGGIECIYRTCEDRRRVLVIEDMNARVGYSEVEDIIYKSGVSEMNENRRKLIELCTEKKFNMGYIYFFLRRRTSVNLHG